MRARHAHRGAGTLGHERADRIHHGRSQDGQNGDIDAVRQRLDAEHTGPRTDGVPLRVDQVDVTVVAEPVEVGEHGGAKCARGGRGADDRDGVWAQESSKVGRGRGRGVRHLWAPQPGLFHPAPWALAVGWICMRSRACQIICVSDLGISRVSRAPSEFWCYTNLWSVTLRFVPTTRPRHLVTESDELKAALDRAASRWPGLSRGQLVARLALAGDEAAEHSEETRRRRRSEVVARHSGAMTGWYRENEVRHLREDWPE